MEGWHWTTQSWGLTFKRAPTGCSGGQGGLCKEEIRMLSRSSCCGAGQELLESGVIVEVELEAPLQCPDVGVKENEESAGSQVWGLRG